MEQIYYGVAIVFYGIFIIRFILSWIGGDFEIDSDADLDISDIVSFKGFTHFVMGLSGWLSVKSLVSTIQWYDYITAIVVGCLFVVMLYYVYKLMLKLESKPTVLEGSDFVGKVGKIYLTSGNDDVYYYYMITVANGNGTVELYARSTNKFNIGDAVMIKSFEGNYYTIYK